MLLILLLLFGCHQPPPRPAPPTPDGVVGLDVSAHQGDVDWDRVAAAGVHFVYLKATEGKTFVDRRFQENWQGARDAGLTVGAYHYFSACRTGTEQARHFLATVPDGADLPAVVDVEPDRRCNRGSRWTKVGPQVDRWLDEVEQATGTRPLLYASDHVHRGHLAGVDAERWVANYSRRPRTQGWALWQHTQRGRVPGVQGDVDRNVASEAFWATR